MISADHVQLGIVQLDLPIPVPTSLTTTSWSELDLSFFQTNYNDVYKPESLPALDLLQRALAEPALGCVGGWQRQAERILVRVAILPSDAKASGKRSRKTEGIVKGLLQSVRRSWDDGEVNVMLLARTAVEDQSMQDIYASVPSPPNPQLSTSSSPIDQEMSDTLMKYESPPGVKTDLYRYQVRSVAKMIQMENDPEKLVDPLWTRLEEAGREGAYYVNLSTWDIQRCPGWYDLPRGGILCEQMGTGKTLMCLSLIVATLHQPTIPPPNSIDITPVATDAAVRTYPFEGYRNLRALIGRSTSEAQLIFPTLVELCANVISTHDPSIRQSPYLPPGIPDLLQRTAFYCQLPPEDECMREAKSRVLQETRKVKKIYLAKTTLVVVPPILVPQWKQEMENHLELGALTVYEVHTKDLPPVNVLMEYDVVLMNVPRFSAEETGHRAALGLGPSVLLEARWKRIILDEGHVAKDKTTLAMSLAIQLSIERRWLVTGTPTRHLQQGGEAEVHARQASQDQTSNDVSGSVAAERKRAWSKRDLEDATRMGMMIGGFLAAEPFKSEGGFQSYVTNHLRARSGPAIGAVARMKNIMDSLLVKHGPRIIDEEAQLPPLTLTKELLQFEPMQRITYNVLAALVSSNVLTSGGEDQDYLLHPKNVESYNQVVNNLHLACFWYSVRDMDAKGCLERTQLWLERHPDAPSDVRAHLEEACLHLQAAIDTPGWEEWMDNAISMPLDTPTLPSLIKDSWSDSPNCLPDLVDVHSALLLREQNRRGANLQEVHMQGWASRATKCEWFMDELSKDEKRQDKLLKKRLKDEEVRHKKAATAAQAPKAAPKSLRTKLKSTTIRKRKLTKGEEALDDQLEQAAKNAATQASTITFASALLNLPRPLPSTLSTKTKSAKVNFVLKAVQESDSSDKFIVFGDNYELGHLTEALDLIDVTSCFAGTTLSSKERRRALDRFEKLDVRVCLLDLKLGARGLNLSVANRMIFLAPVWNLDTQAQAIKRVHRIGQKRETRVQILITEGTFEEDIARRSTVHASDEEEKLYSRTMIENPRFVYPEKEEAHRFQIRFTPKGEEPPPVIISDAQTPPTPMEVFPTTPVSGATARDGASMYSATTLEKYSVMTDINEYESPDLSLKRKSGDQGGGKKRAKVAFA